MNKKILKKLRENASKGGQKTLQKYGNSHFSDISKKGVEKRMKGITQEQRSGMMKCVRMKQFGWKWNREKMKCENLGVAFGSNVKKNK